MALCLGGAVASGTIVIKSTTQIQKGAVRSSDLRNGTVADADIGENAISSDEIGTGSIGTSEAGFPEGETAVEQPGDVASANVEGEFALVDVVTTYDKESAETGLVVTWDGTAGSGMLPCVFQIRVDGQPSGPNAGETYMTSGSSGNVSAGTEFAGLAAGPHEISVYAHTLNAAGAAYPCTVGPASAAIGQTFQIDEVVH